MEFIDVAGPEPCVESITPAHLKEVDLAFHCVESVRLDKAGHNVLLSRVLGPFCPGHHHEGGNPVANRRRPWGFDLRFISDQMGAEAGAEKKVQERIGLGHDFSSGYHKRGSRAIHWLEQS